MKPYQCNNRPPFKTETVLQDHHGRVVSQWPAVMAKDCRYTHTELGQADARCGGCKHRVTMEGAQ